MSGAEPREWLIRKGGYFYRANWCGYTTEKDAAGRYTEAEARKEAEIEPWHMAAVHQDSVPGTPLDDATAELATLRQRLEELSKTSFNCHDAVGDEYGNFPCPQKAEVAQLRANLARVTAERDEAHDKLLWLETWRATEEGQDAEKALGVLLMREAIQHLCVETLQERKHAARNAEARATAAEAARDEAKDSLHYANGVAAAERRAALREFTDQEIADEAHRRSLRRHDADRAAAAEHGGWGLDAHHDR